MPLVLAMMSSTSQLQAEANGEAHCSPDPIGVDDLSPILHRAGRSIPCELSIQCFKRMVHGGVFIRSECEHCNDETQRESATSMRHDRIRADKTL